MNVSTPLSVDDDARRLGVKSAIRLTALPRGIPAVVACPSPHAGSVEPTVVERLAEIGVLEGQIVKVLAVAPFGGPLAVRIGSGTFALRRDEAAHVWVHPRTGPGGG